MLTFASVCSADIIQKYTSDLTDPSQGATVDLKANDTLVINWSDSSEYKDIPVLTYNNYKGSGNVHLYVTNSEERNRVCQLNSTQATIIPSEYSNDKVFVNGMIVRGPESATDDKTSIYLGTYNGNKRVIVLSNLNPNDSSQANYEGVLENHVTNFEADNDILIQGVGGLRAGWSQVLTVSGCISDYDTNVPGKLIIESDSGTIKITNESNNYSGGTQIGGGSNCYYYGTAVLEIAVDGTSLGTGPVYFGSSVNENNFELKLAGHKLTIGGLGLPEGETEKVIGKVTSTSSAELTIKPINPSDKYVAYSSIQNSIKVIKDGEGTQTFASQNTYTGDTVIKQGTLKLTNVTNVIQYSSAIIVDTNGDLVTTTNQKFNNLKDGDNGGGDIYADGASIILTLNNTDATSFSGIISNGTTEGSTVSIDKTGTGSLTLSGINTYTGTTTITTGTLKLTGVGTLGNTASNISNKGTLEFAYNLGDSGDNSIFNRIITGDGGNVVKSGTGTITLNQKNTYTGTTTITAGTLKLTGDGTLGSGTVAIDTNGTLEVNVASGEKTLTNTITGVEVSETLTNKGTVKKTGEGILKLNTAVNSITVEKFIQQAGELDIKGTLYGDLDLEGGTFSPGNSVGDVTVDGNTAIKSSALMMMEVGGKDGVNTDTFTTTGDLTLEPGATIFLDMVADSGLKGGDTIEVKFTAANSADLTSDLISKYVRSYYFTDLQYVNTGDYYAITGRLDPSAVPEPSTWALLILGFAGLMWYRKRERR